jgi:predicted DNA-binding transcriptional regulator YafY
MKRDRTSRIIQLLTVLQSRRQHTAADLATVLGTSRRTVFRDLKSLKEAGVKYRFNQRGGCYDTKSSFLLPPLALTAEEAFALLLLVYKGRNHIVFPLRNAALMAGLKVENNLQSDIRRYCVRALRTVSYQPNPVTAGELYNKTFAQIQKAIMDKRQIKIRYYCPQKHREIDMEINPYHLIYSRQTWYLLGKPKSDARINAVRLSTIKNVHILDSSFIEEAPFDLHEYLGRAWSMLPEGRLYDVKLRFIPEVAYDVTAVRWHETQSVHFEDDGSAIVEFRVDGLNEITWWILSYGDQVEVIAPRVLRQRIIEIAQRIANPPKSASVSR